ncbi:putative mitochondrial carrier [Zancudomyces culisetae]|uniref:Putative mitochondrial carrier n=1 Tax=Zancudomyces culisetae TaxID=1213189 RepID=A0A1R1PYW5_ZANCU|nr:putative mitochondrial carrier [Zancudomyces culisetae]OMH86145.1 putative mitochondrial carrier [Zancudomyces culisetae]|eukprot:OMH84817.1 putative mitochondrial carrier [Zancudomyces culisetae]
MTISNDIDYEELSENEPMYMHLAAGAAAGIMEHTIVYPFDSIKTRMQIVSKGQSMVIYDGVINSIKLISTTEGFKALWRGVASVCIGAGPAHALYFASYEKAKTMLGGSDDSKMKPIAAGK